VNDTAEQAGNGTPSEPVSGQSNTGPKDVPGTDSQSVEAAAVSASAEIPAVAAETPVDATSADQDDPTEPIPDVSASAGHPAADSSSPQPAKAAESPETPSDDSVLDLDEEVASKSAKAVPTPAEPETVPPQASEPEAPEPAVAEPPTAEPAEAEAGAASQVTGDAEIAEMVEPDPLAILELQLQESQAAAQEFRDQLYRKAAELENTRRRLSKQLRDAKKYAGDSVLREFLPVNDDLERAIEHASASAAEDGDGEKNAQVSSFIDGMTLVLRKFTATLERFGVKGFASIGEPFSPQLHEAIQQITTTEIEPGHVAAEFLRGYMMHDRLLRPALVAVAAPPAAAAPEAPPAEEPAEEAEVIDLVPAESAPEAAAADSAPADTQDAATEGSVAQAETAQDSGASPAQDATEEASKEKVVPQEDTGSGSLEAASEDSTDQA